MKVFGSWDAAVPSTIILGFECYLVSINALIY
jgi:hypothetical protein